MTAAPRREAFVSPVLGRAETARKTRSNELLRLVADFEGVMIHEACRTRGDARCIWRAERAQGYE